MFNNKPYIIFLIGPTSSGKTNFIKYLYHFLPIEVISVDSVSIYRGLDIGSAKPSKNFLLKIPHHLINILDPSQKYSVFNFFNDALYKIKKIISYGKIPILVGGTMLYFNILLNGISSLPPSDINVRKFIIKNYCNNKKENLYVFLQKIDYISSKKIHPNDINRILRALEVFFLSGSTLTKLLSKPKKNIKYKIYQFAVKCKKDVLKYRSFIRFYKMLQRGFEKEVRYLFDRGDLNLSMPSIRSIGYRQMWNYISGIIDYNTMVNSVIFSTYRLIKNQITWLKKWKNIYWIDLNFYRSSFNKIKRIINSV